MIADTLDTFADGDYTNSPTWTPYVAAQVTIAAGGMVCTVPVTNEGAAASTPQTRNIGVFQFESSGMRRYMKDLKPTVFEDLALMSSTPCAKVGT